MLNALIERDNLSYGNLNINRSEKELDLESGLESILTQRSFI